VTAGAKAKTCQQIDRRGAQSRGVNVRPGCLSQFPSGVHRDLPAGSGLLSGFGIHLVPGVAQVRSSSPRGLL